MKIKSITTALKNRAIHLRWATLMQPSIPKIIKVHRYFCFIKA
ncbi:hypothetical protein [uncultured Gammaproteobacteria bacterium]|nr:hypothetical protein [uncultured Gammaproteobacteria bacterium]